MELGQSGGGSVNDSGLVTGVSDGMADITASFGGLTSNGLSVVVIEVSPWETGVTAVFTVMESGHVNAEIRNLSTKLFFKVATKGQKGSIGFNVKSKSQQKLGTSIIESQK